MLRRERLLDFCRSLPHVTEDVKWGADLCFSIGGKMFAVFGMSGAGFSCKATEDGFHALTADEDAGIVPAPYVARYFWIMVKDPKALSQGQAEALVQESYDLVRAALPARVRKGFDEPPEKKPAKKRAR